MKVRKLTLPVLPALLILLSLSSESTAQNDFTVRNYRSENGRQVSITSNGNVISLESPAGYENIGAGRIREGYVLAYVDANGTTRVVHDVFDSFSSTIKPNMKDFVPVSFTAPPSSEEIAVNTPITATAVHDTRDGLLRIENSISWTAGTGMVNVTMTVTNRSNSVPVRILTIKRVSDANAGGVKLNNSFVAGRTVYFFNPTCLCRPPIPPGPWIPLVTISGTGNSTALNLAAGDDSELFSAGPGESLPGPQTGIDTQAAIVYKVNAFVNPGAFRVAAVMHEVR